MISTHHDKIWRAGCQRKEDAIVDLLNAHGLENRLVDVIPFPVDQMPPNFVTDNYFRQPVDYCCIAPMFWHIYRFDEFDEIIEPKYKFNCNINRVSGERLMLLYKLAENSMLDQGLVSFNCLYHDMDPDANKRKENYDAAYAATGWTKYNQIHQELRQKMPMIVSTDPDQSAMLSHKTLVVESYVSDSVIAFSEKIFRALQTPRPWALYCSPDSVAKLRHAGFDVLDDVIDHSYDCIEDRESRLDAVINEINKDIDFDLLRYTQAVTHNQSLLDKFKDDWDDYLSYLLQSTS